MGILDEDLSGFLDREKKKRMGLPDDSPESALRSRVMTNSSIAPPNPQPGLELPGIGKPIIKNPQFAKDDAELQRLKSTGAGVDQIENPVGRVMAKVADIAGSALFPRLATAIPGTTMHHQKLMAQAQTNVNQDLNQTKVEETLAQAQAEQARQTAQDHERQREFDTRIAETQESRHSREQQAEEARIQREQDSQANRDFRADQSTRDREFRGQQASESRALQRELSDERRDEKERQNTAKADTQVTGLEARYDRLAAAAKAVKDHPGLKGITGKMGVLPNMPGGDAANAQAKLETLKSQVAFGVLQEMRNESKTGGALGQVSDKEGQLLQTNLAALDRSQSYEEYQASLQNIMDYAESAKARARDALGRQHPSTTATPAIEEYGFDPATKKLVKKQVKQP